MCVCVCLCMYVYLYNETPILGQTNKNNETFNL